MKKSTCCVPVIAFYFLTAVLSGCATVKEMGKGFAGISTKVLEDKRPESLKKSFPLDYDSCYAAVKKLLGEEGQEPGKENEGSYIYAEPAGKKMIALYLSEVDTTPVGIFFTAEKKNKTLIEVSSPSTYAKEYIAKKVFTGIEKQLKSKSQEKKSDVKEEAGNK